MTDRNTPLRPRGLDRRGTRTPAAAAAGLPAPVLPAPAAEPHPDLLKRSEKIGGRHAAITNSLYSLHSYKSWADKMRGNFEDKK
jgi:hypothetical protein